MLADAAGPGKRRRTVACRCPDEDEGPATCEEGTHGAAPRRRPEARWRVTARAGDPGPHGKTLIIDWATPRPMIEIKLGLGLADTKHGAAPTNFDTKHKTYKVPQSSGSVTFTEAALRKRFVGEDKWCMAAMWDDQRPERPAAWSPAFNIREREGTEQFTVGAATSSSGFIACEQHCRVASEWAGSELSALLPPQRQKTGADQLQRYGLRDLLQLLREDTSPSLRVLRLKHYIDADAKCLTIDTVLNALENSSMVEALYIHNFEDGMRDAQLEHLSRVLRKGHIWALNVGENFKLSAQAWRSFADTLPDTHVTHMYASEPNFGGVSDKLKLQMRASIRQNRLKDLRHKCPHRAAIIQEIGQMWWNPRNGFVRERALFGAALTSDDLRGAEIQIYRNQDASWRSAHIVEIASATDGVLDECRVRLDNGTIRSISLQNSMCMVACELVWISSSSGSVKDWLPGQVFRHNFKCQHERGRRMAGFAYVRIWKGSSSCMTWVENKPTSILPFQANVDRCWRRHEDVVVGIRAAQRAEAAKAFYRRESLQAQADDGS